MAFTATIQCYEPVTLQQGYMMGGFFQPVLRAINCPLLLADTNSSLFSHFCIFKRR